MVKRRAGRFGKLIFRDASYENQFSGRFVFARSIGSLALSLSLSLYVSLALPSLSPSVLLRLSWPSDIGDAEGAGRGSTGQYTAYTHATEFTLAPETKTTKKLKSVGRR